MSKIFYGKESQEGLKKGVDLIANAVKTTLGGKGRNVMIDEGLGQPIITKDGVTVAKAVTSDEPLIEQGVKLIQSVASKTNTDVNDGTTTSTILAQAIVEQGLNFVDSGSNPIYLQRGLNIGLSLVEENLKNQIKVVDVDNYLEEIASTSANDKNIGKLIADTYKKIGKNGQLSVETHVGKETYVDYVEGMVVNEFSSEWMESQLNDNGKTTIENPLILVSDFNVNTRESFVKDVESELYKAISKKQPIILVVNDISSDIFIRFVTATHQKLFNIFILKAPNKELLDDMAIFLGAKNYSNNENMFDVKLDELGSCSKVEIQNDSFVLLGGKGSEELIVDRINYLEGKINEDNPEHIRVDYEKRLSNMTSGGAILHLGANSELELKEIKDRVDDALNASKAALKHGVLPGGGVALLNSNIDLTKYTEYDEDILKGIVILNNILNIPIQTILGNAGEDYNTILKTIKNRPLNTGYDVVSGKYGDMFDLGIVDPYIVTMSALKNAISVAGTLLTTECVIIND